MSNIISSPLDQKAIFVSPETKKIEFRDNRFYRCLEATHKDQYVPSNTTVLNLYPKDVHFYKWLKKFGDDADTISAEAMEKGSNVHKLTEIFDLNGSVNFLNNDYMDGRVNYTLQEMRMFDRYYNFASIYKPFNHAIEWAGGSGVLGYGGCLDRICDINKETWLIDIKTGNEYEYYWCQLAAYKNLWEYFNPQLPIKRIGILYLNTKHRTQKFDEFQGIGWKLEEMPAATTPKYRGVEPYKYWLWRFGKYLSEYQEIYPDAKPNSKIFSTEYQKTW